MDMRVRRAWMPAVLAVALLLLLGWHAVPAHAVSVDPELVAESVSEDGYYVDSSASYLKSDADLDRLRSALDGAGRAGVVVLPAGVPAQPVITRLLNEPNRRATYVVLSGARLQAVSNSMAAPKVNGLVAKARRAGDPKAQVLAFLDLMGGKHPVTGGKQKPSAPPSAQASSGTGDTGASASPAAAAGKDSGGNGMLYGVIGVVVIVILAALGFFLWRRKQGTSDPGTPPGPSGPGGPGGPGGPDGPGGTDLDAPPAF
jgi:hypothetical protein